jgi:activator of HSP90 ATPase
MKSKTIKQKISFKASGHDVYEALMDSKKHAMFTGGTAKISRKLGGKFSVYDGYAFGKNLELIPDKKIVQTWIASDWEEGHESKVVFEIESTKTGCKLIFVQTNVPAEHFSSIKQGWIDFYWLPMKEILENTLK